MNNQNKNRAALLGCVLVGVLACSGALAAEKKTSAAERSVPLDRSGYFEDRKSVV